MAQQLRTINLRIDVDLLEQVDQAAAACHMDRSNYIRSCLRQSLGQGPSSDKQLLDEVEVVDERAREIVKDVIRRVEIIEAFIEVPRVRSRDPFNQSLYNRIDDLAEPLTSVPDPTLEEAQAMLQGPGWLAKKAKGEKTPGPYTQLLQRYLDGTFVIPEQGKR